MLKNTITFIVLAVLTLGTCLSVQAGDLEIKEFDAPEDGLEINHIPGHSERDLSVEFNHSSHESFSCKDCHHRMDELKGQAAPRSCAVCHDNFSPDNFKGYKSYFKAMHEIRFAPNGDRPSCLGCHTKEFGTDDSDMTGCLNSACHSEGIH